MADLRGGSFCSFRSSDEELLDTSDISCAIAWAWATIAIVLFLKKNGEHHALTNDHCEPYR